MFQFVTPSRKNTSECLVLKYISKSAFQKLREMLERLLIKTMETIGLKG
jgi:hypothetical protein